jgi:hypothetical protein
MQWLDGKKTYVVGAVSILSAVVAAYYGTTTWDDAAKIIETAVLGMTIRHGVTTEAK